MTSPKKKPQRKLKKAPLIEVVFELRWVLSSKSENSENDPFSLYDPAYPLVRESFSKEVKKAGYKHSIQMGNKSFPISIPYSVETRYFLDQEQKFPMMQIGVGIFATNTDGSKYVWEDFKKQILDGIKALTNSYPNTGSFKLKPAHLELRYIDFFDPQFLLNKNNASIQSFINNETSANLSLPQFKFQDLIGPFDTGRLTLKSKLKKIKNSEFIIDIGSGTREEIESVRLESRVITAAKNGLSIKSGQKIEDYVKIWLEDVRAVLSPFFEDFLEPALLKKLDT